MSCKIEVKNPTALSQDEIKIIELSNRMLTLMHEQKIGVIMSALITTLGNVVLSLDDKDKRHLAMLDLTNFVYDLAEEVHEMDKAEAH